MSGFRYRAGQFLRALFPTAPSELSSTARILLNERELQLFNRMLPFDRAHSLEVFRQVAEIAPANRALQTAALLHDIGKGKPRLSHRVGLVVAQSFGFDLSKWRRAPARTFRGDLYNLANHAEVGARFLEAAGSDPEVVAIVRGYHPEKMAESELLMKVDSRC